MLAPTTWTPGAPLEQPKLETRIAHSIAHSIWTPGATLDACACHAMVMHAADTTVRLRMNDTGPSSARPWRWLAPPGPPHAAHLACPVGRRSGRARPIGSRARPRRPRGRQSRLQLRLQGEREGAVQNAVWVVVDVGGWYRGGRCSGLRCGPQPRHGAVPCRQRAAGLRLLLLRWRLLLLWLLQLRHQLAPGKGDATRAAGQPGPLLYKHLRVCMARTRVRARVCHGHVYVARA
jgi:hypothetical protein